MTSSDVGCDALGIFLDLPFVGSMQLQWLIAHVTIACILKHVTTVHVHNYVKTARKLPVIVSLFSVASTLVITFLAPNCNLPPCRCLAVVTLLSLPGLPP